MSGQREQSIRIDSYYDFVSRVVFLWVWGSAARKLSAVVPKEEVHDARIGFASSSIGAAVYMAIASPIRPHVFPDLGELREVGERSYDVWVSDFQSYLFFSFKAHVNWLSTKTLVQNEFSDAKPLKAFAMHSS